MRPILLLLAATVGCGGLEHLVDMKVPVDADGTTECSVDGTRTIDLSSNADFTKYREYIEGAELASARVVVTALGEGNQATEASGTVRFRTAAGEDLSLFTYELPLQPGAEVEVAPDPTAAQALMDQLLAAPHTAEILTDGTADALPCRFSFDIETEVRFEVKPSVVFAQ